MKDREGPQHTELRSHKGGSFLEDVRSSVRESALMPFRREADVWLEAVQTVLSVPQN